MKLKRKGHVKKESERQEEKKHTQGGKIGEENKTLKKDPEKQNMLKGDKITTESKS